MTSTCPGCTAPLSGAPTCPTCGLQVVGPTATRLREVDHRLGLLTGEQRALLEERARLLALLRSGQAPQAVVAPAVYGTAPAQPRRESSPQQVQNTLLSLGALLLALAGIVFAAVTYRHLGPVGRAAILLSLTGAAGAAPVVLAKRGLTASAEAVGTVALVLGVVDAWALRRAGFAAGVDVRSYDAVATALLALACGAYARLLPLRSSRMAAVALGQLPVVFVLARFRATLPVTAVTLTLLAAIDLLLTSSGRLAREIRATAAGFAGVGLTAALLTSVAAVEAHDRAGGAGLLALGLVAAVTSMRLARARAALSGLSVLLVAAAVWAAARPELTAVQQPLLLVGVAMMTLLAAGLLARPNRTGPVLGALTVAAVALVTQAEPLLVAVAGPFTWFSQPWTLTSTGAAAAVSIDESWTGSSVTLVVVLAAASCCLTAGLALDRLTAALPPLGGLLALSAVVLPLSLSTGYPMALVLLLTAAGVLLAAGLLTTGSVSLTLLGAGGLTALHAAGWSTADRGATLTVLPTVALLACGLSLRLPWVSGVAAALAGATLAAVGADQDLSPEQVGGLLLLAPAVCVALSRVLGRAYRISLEIAAGLLGATSVALSAEDPGWLSWTVAGCGLLCLTVAIRPDRRQVGLAGGLLLSASSWVRLADAGVQSPEPYVVPLAVAALALGFLRRRSHPQVSSFEAYGAGLSLALFPSLLKALSDPTPTRGLVLVGVCLVVLLAGSRQRLQAPLAIGGTVLAADALHLLAPYASALPRWSLLAASGTLLVVVGATYEQRRRDVTRLKESYSSLA